MGGLTEPAGEKNEPVERLSKFERALWDALAPEFEPNLLDPVEEQNYRNMVARVQKAVILDLIALPGP